jgi:hypothetical protein
VTQRSSTEQKHIYLDSYSILSLPKIDAESISNRLNEKSLVKLNYQAFQRTFMKTTKQYC